MTSPAVSEPPSTSEQFTYQPDTPSWSRWLTPAIVAVIALGVLVRALHVLSSDFPLNDGGLFYAMTQDLQQSGYRLPDFTSYNDASIPFSYPPLGFYASALVADLTPLSLEDVFRFLPLAATCLTLPAFYLLARSLLGSGLVLIAALAAFALIPRSFIWLLMGGGVTRSLGLLFAILALYAVQRLYSQRRQVYLIPATVLAGLTVLSHLETAWFLAFSTALLFVAFGRHRQGVVGSLVIMAGTLAITAPWWLTVIDRHGFDPFLAAQATGGSIFSDAETRHEVYLGLARFVSTSEPYFPLIGTIGLLGALVSLTRRHFLLPAWWALIILLDVRAYPTFTAIPVAMLAGMGVSEVLLPLLHRSMSQAPETQVPGATDPTLIWPNAQVWLPRAVLGAILLYATFSAVTRTPGLNGEAPLLVGLSGDERAAMQWVARESPPESRFLVVPDSGWETAKTAEWFPILAERVSVTTVQGSEWLEGNAFREHVEAHWSALECGYRTATCLDLWAWETGVDFTHVYIPRTPDGQCCWTLVNSLATDTRYQVVYAGPGATIFARGASEPQPQELASQSQP
jgi:hypothetical protein